jgi:hypothetical protein
MEDNAYLASIAAGIFYLLAGVHLFRLNRRTRELPELLLSIFFLLSGIFYVSYNIPSLFGLEEWSGNADWAINGIYLLGVVPYIFFISIVFRPDSYWGGVGVGFLLAILMAGGVLPYLEGNDSNLLSNPWFFLEWGSYTLPVVWMLFEAVNARKGAAKRVRIGLCPPTVANRYLLLASFAGFQFVACLADLSYFYEIGNAQAVSMFTGVLLGTAEMTSVSVLWLAFFPPTFYTDWINQSEPAASFSGGAG